MRRRRLLRRLFSPVAAGSMLLCAIPFAGAVVRVATGPPPPIPYAKQHALVAVLFEGTPIAGARIGIWAEPFTAKPLVLTTRSAGTAVLQHLGAGRYRFGLLALISGRDRSAEHLQGAGLGLSASDVCIRSCPGAHLSGKTLREIRFDLAPDRDPLWAFFTEGAPKEPDAYKLREFRGTVVDPTGAEIPGATIIVVTEGIKGAEYAADSRGNFSIPLGNAQYEVLVGCSGFAPRLLHVWISPAASAGAWRVRLNVGRAYE